MFRLLVVIIYFFNLIESTKWCWNTNKSTKKMRILCKGLIICLFLTREVFSYTYENVNNLLNEILITNNYNKDVRPTLTFDRPIDVQLLLLLHSINSIDVVSQIMKATVYLEVEWEDELLVWIQRDHNWIQNVSIPQSKIWLPDIALQNGILKPQPLGSDSLMASVTSRGHVVWAVVDVFETFCEIDITYFPFDIQVCFISLDSVVTDSGTSYEGLGDYILDEYIENEEWEILEVSVSNKNYYNGEIVTSVIFEVVVKRRPTFFITSVMMPIICLSVLGVFTFLIPSNSGEKIGYCMTVLLSFAVFLTSVREFLPASSKTSVMSRYLMILLAQSTLIVIISALELRLCVRNHLNQPVPAWLIGMISFKESCGCTLWKRNAVKDEVTVVENLSPINQQKGIIGAEKNSIDTTWTDVVSVIDFVCFWVFLLTLFATTLIMLGISYFNSV